MSPVVSLVVVLGASVAAIAVDLLYDSGDQPATEHDERRSGWEPWPTIWRRSSRRASIHARSTGRRTARITRGLGRAGWATTRAVALAPVRAARATYEVAHLTVEGTTARARNLRQRRALLRSAQAARTRARAEAQARERARQLEVALRRLDETRMHAAQGAGDGARARRDPPGRDGAPFPARGPAVPAPPAGRPVVPAPSGFPVAAGGNEPTLVPRPDPTLVAGAVAVDQPSARRRLRHGDVTGDRAVAGARRPGGVVPRRPGVSVPLRAPMLGRVKAIVGLLIIAFLLGIALAALVAAAALVVFEALGGL